MITGDRDSAQSHPRPFTTMPIVYERAFGGTAQAEIDWRNPVGIGHQGARSADPAVESAMPNVEYADGRPAPAGFGAIARQWQPRVGFAGTYDAAWLDGRAPFLPENFDPQYHQAAPLDQQSQTIRGGEPVAISNMTPEGLWRFNLPTLRVPVRVWYADRGFVGTLRLDTVLIEPDAYRVTLKARMRFAIERRRAPLRQVIVGHVTPGWWRSRLRKKQYIDWRGLEGRDPTEADYTT
jgi:hypothetical protein